MADGTSLFRTFTPGFGQVSNREHFDVATHIYTRLRRLSSRTIDVIWMVHNAEYAREVLKLARVSGDPETVRLAERFELMAFGAVTKAAPQALNGAPAPAAAAAPAEDGYSGDRYVGTLR